MNMQIQRTNLSSRGVWGSKGSEQILKIIIQGNFPEIKRKKIKLSIERAYYPWDYQGRKMNTNIYSSKITAFYREKTPFDHLGR